MLLQTNSYIVPKEKRTEHARLLQRFKQLMAKLGCDHFEVFEQVGVNWSGGETGRFVQIMRFRDRQHVLAVQAAEKGDPQAKALIQEFCDLVNLPYQQQAGLFAAGYYNSVIAMPMTGSGRPVAPARRAAIPASGIAGAAAAAVAAESVELASVPDETPSEQPAVVEQSLQNPFDLQSDDAPSEPTAAAEVETANGDIDILDYLDDVEPAGKKPPPDRLD